MKKVLIIVGSLRKESYNKKLALSVEKMLEGKAEVVHGDFSQFPLFNEDIEMNMPEAVINFKSQVENTGGILIITPEYNRSIPGGLKNAIDWATRPDGKNSFKGKTVYFMGVSSGKLGTVTAQYDLRRIFTYFGCEIVGQPEMFLGPAKDIYDESKNTFNDKTLEFVQKGVETFLSKI